MPPSGLALSPHARRAVRITSCATDASSQPSLLSAAAFSFVFRGVGQLSVLTVLWTLLRRSSPLSVWLTSAAPLRRAVFVWAAAEAVFYLVCCLLATYMSLPGKSEPSAAWDRAARKQMWSKILTDPTTPTTQYVESWFLRKYRPRAVSSALAVLVAFGFAREDPEEVAAAQRVSYGELSRGDVRAWLAGNFFEARPKDLGPTQRDEVDEFIARLEAAAGPLLPTEVTSRAVRPMRPCFDPIPWRHHPLLYYLLTHAIFARLVTPYVLKQRGFTRRQQHGIGYYAFAPPTNEASDEAIVFIHGVGVGPAPYVQLLRCSLDDAPLTMTWHCLMAWHRVASLDDVARRAGWRATAL
jgi:hypothetical protein